MLYLFSFLCWWHTTISKAWVSRLSSVMVAPRLLPSLLMSLKSIWRSVYLNRPLSLLMPSSVWNIVSFFVCWFLFAYFLIELRTSWLPDMNFLPLHADKTEVLVVRPVKYGHLFEALSVNIDGCTSSESSTIKTDGCDFWFSSDIFLTAFLS